MKVRSLIDQLDADHNLNRSDYELLLKEWDSSDAAYAAAQAVIWRQSYFSNKIYVRGLIEFTNYCKNNCR